MPTIIQAKVYRISVILAFKYVLREFIDFSGFEVQLKRISIKSKGRSDEDFFEHQEKEVQRTVGKKGFLFEPGTCYTRPRCIYASGDFSFVLQEQQRGFYILGEFS
ncbi:MAG: hypothetical protein V4492_00780 [Chlamydiota bacterium]